MKRTFISSCSLILTLTILFVLMFPLSISVQAISDFSVGDTVVFGFYPQTEITDENLLAKLNLLTLEWISYDYYAGDPDGNQVPQDFMKYADVEYGGIKYRAVTFTKHRPRQVTSEPFDYSNQKKLLTRQDDYGYFANNVYWFKYEPLKWTIIDPDEGFLLCENVIDAQPISNTMFRITDSSDSDGDTFSTSYFRNVNPAVYLNDYSKSDIRDWLNDDFYNLAFSEIQQNNIRISEIDNTAGGKYDYDTYKYYNGDTTFDKVFLPSYFEMLNPQYGFSTDPSEDDEARKAKSTDYAKIQGVWTEIDESDADYGYAQWYLRTAASESRYIGYVYQSGGCWSFVMAEGLEKGVRPAIKLDNLGLNIKWNVHGDEFIQIYSQGEKIVPPKLPEKQGYISIWNAEIPDVMPAKSLEFSANWVSITETVYTVKTFTMDTDGDYIERSETLEGKTGELVQAQFEVPENFVINNDKSVLSGIIKEDNSLVLKVYLDRQKYSLTTVIGSEIKNVSYYYGADIPKPDAPEKEGYKFIGWSQEIPDKMPAKNLTATALFVEIYSGVKISIVTPENSHIEYGETITLRAYVSNMPANAKIKWRIVEGKGVSIEPSVYGDKCVVTSVSTGNCVIEAYVVNEYGNVIHDENGAMVCDREGISSEVNLWMIIIWVIKNILHIA